MYMQHNTMNSPHLVWVPYTLKRKPWVSQIIGYKSLNNGPILHANLHANCLCPEFAKISCHEIFLFYSIIYTGCIGPSVLCHVCYQLYQRIMEAYNSLVSSTPCWRKTVGPNIFRLPNSKNLLVLELVSFFCCGNFVGPTDFGSPTVKTVTVAETFDSFVGGGPTVLGPHYCWGDYSNERKYLQHFGEPSFVSQPFMPLVSVITINCITNHTKTIW